MLTLITRYVLGAVVLLLAVQTWRLHDAKADLATANANLTIAAANQRTLQDANDTNAATITALKSANAAMVAQNKAAEQALSSARANLTAATKARDAARAALKTKENEIYANSQTCKTWGDQPVCGAISGQLLEQLRQAGGEIDDGSGGSASTVRGDPRGLDVTPNVQDRTAESPRSR